ncbi:acetylornithine deacetylase/succinyl-diaminopimelate desuccinylase-like protein [Streptomyces sp. 1114.5]|uniref:dipeptidase n=1 Tax=unclassified Streptomyces TaxID=2593676 RepID=UPI000BDD0A83|nr:MULTISPECIES: dipeptidase [unclassified Streptomyces]RKT17330.1 acetylornithine deacetylase/succinyl-diaminopimelate desuccinylase-like protein [Streptomyces sp. 1114.5]SOB83538.1 Acetylornithine deacetylase/Succinyl-diaminopimelate desuccinylase [Streptomyces sp. 1331.2]
MTDELALRISELMPRAQADLAELVAIPSVADPRQYPPEKCRQAAEWVAAAFTEAGLRDVHLEETPDGSHAVIGHRPPPPGAPTVLLYSHYDVQPPLDDAAWESPPFRLTERDGRWYGRGAADCKGNIVMHLTALRALGEDIPVGLKLVVEGSEEQGTGGLERYLPPHAGELHADALLVCDTGNAAVGVPTATTSLRGVANAVVTVRALKGDLHSGMFGGAAPDALAALVRMLDALRDADGGTRIDGLDCDGTWSGAGYDEAAFRTDAGVLDGVRLTGSGTVADRLWARPAVTVLGIDCPPVVGSTAAVPATARARVSLRVPPGTDAGTALDALIAHLEAAAPWGVRVEFVRESAGSPFRADTGGPGYAALDQAMQEVYGRPMSFLGQGGSIPLCNVLAATYPDAEIILMGVEEPRCLIHAPNESVDPGEIANMARVEALFLRNFADSAGR